MCHLQDDNWWISLLKDKTSEPHSQHTFGYHKAHSQSLAMGHVNLPNVSSDPRCAQWWTAIACGKDERAADESTTNSLAVNEHSPNTSTVSDLSVSPGDASASKAACV